MTRATSSGSSVSGLVVSRRLLFVLRSLLDPLCRQDVLTLKLAARENYFVELFEIPARVTFIDEEATSILGYIELMNQSES